MKILSYLQRSKMDKEETASLSLCIDSAFVRTPCESETVSSFLSELTRFEPSGSNPSESEPSKSEPCGSNPSEPEPS